MLKHRSTWKFAQSAYHGDAQNTKDIRTKYAVLPGFKSAAGRCRLRKAQVRIGRKTCAMPETPTVRRSTRYKTRQCVGTTRRTADACGCYFDGVMDPKPMKSYNLAFNSCAKIQRGDTSQIMINKARHEHLSCWRLWLPCMNAYAKQSCLAGGAEW